MRRASAIVIAIALGSTLALTGPASADEPAMLRMDIEITWSDPPGYWWGGVEGDVTGMVTYTAWPGHEGYATGQAAHFFETFTICVGEPVTMSGCTDPTEGEYIVGTLQGLYSLKGSAGKWTFRANGVVTDASPEWEFLIGYRYHENGVTTSPFEAVTYGEGRGFITAR